MTTNTSPVERAQDAASTATDEGRHVAGVAREEAQNVASTAAEQARSLVGEARSQVTSQVDEQVTGRRDQLVGMLGSLGEDLDSMAQGGSGLAADLVREVSDRARTLGQHLDGREPGQLLDDARDFARRRPGTFLLGALAAGVVAGRLFRGAAEGTAGAAVAAERQPVTPESATTPLATATPPVPSTTTSPPMPSATTSPPMPPATPGQPTMDPPGVRP